MPIRLSLICLVLLAAGTAQAQERPPRLGEQPDAASPASAPVAKDEQAGKARKEARDARPAADAKAARTPVRRRAVPMIVERMPAPAAPAVYGPVLTVPGPAPTPAPVVPAAPPAPVFINGCDPGGCNGSNGVRYNGAGSTVLSPQGRLCNSNGITVQC